MAVTTSQNAKTYSFESVGELDDTTLESQAAQDAALFPIGIKTPIELEIAQGDFVVMHRNLADNIRDNFRNMILTNRGERLLLGDFGGNLLPLAFELIDENGINGALARIKSTTEKYMPYISLSTFEPLVTESEGG